MRVLAFHRLMERCETVGASSGRFHCIFSRPADTHTHVTASVDDCFGYWQNGARPSGARAVATIINPRRIEI